MGNNTISEISLSTQEVLRRLEKCAIGETVPYKELSHLALGDIQHGKRHSLTTATHRLLMDKGIVFESIRNVGVIRLDDTRIVNTSGAGVKKIRRMAKKNMVRLSSVEYGKLNTEDKLKHNTMMTIYKVTSHVTDSKTEKVVESKTREGHDMMAVGDVFKLFTAK